MEWQKQVRELIRQVRFNKGKRPKFNESQCDNLSRAFLSKISKFCPVGWSTIVGATPKNKRVPQCLEEDSRISALRHEKYDESSKILLQQAWKDVYRVIREAEMYLHSCSGPEWWRKTLALAASGEAHVLHMHDLLWSVVCLDLSLAYATDFEEEAYTEILCRRMGEFEGEMNSPLRIHDEYVDGKQLVSNLSATWKEYESKTRLRKIILNNEEEHKAKLAKFLTQRLHGEFQDCGGTESTIPRWLRIDPQDLKRKNQRQHPNQDQNIVDCDQMCEASWLGIRVCMKAISLDSCECFQKKAQDLARLQSPFLVQFYGVCLDGEKCYMVTEMVSSNLVKLLEERPSIPLQVAIDIMLQISRGMEYLHSQRVMHLDLRPCNVLFEPSLLKEFRDEGHGRVKILMAALRLKNTESLVDSVSPWIAPEAHGEMMKQCTYEADVYSFGMICYHILTGKQPLEDHVPDGKLYERITERQMPVLPLSSCPALLLEYISKCWDTNPANRPHFYEISKFFRYMKLLVMRIPSPQIPISFWSVCREFDREYVTKCFEGTISAEERVTSEEEGLIIRALDGDFPECFRTLNACEPKETIETHPLAPRRSFSVRFLLRPQGNDIKYLVSLPSYIKKYSYEEIHKATSGFELRLMKITDSFSVWKAILPDKTHVAVKLFEKSNSEKFRNEATVLSQLHHPNIIRLRGVCSGSSKYMLVYDYMAMGTLDKQLFTTGHQSHVLNWIMRRRIALGLARGLAYLHHDCCNKFLNIQIDTNSILLDERFSAKLCGFGLARPAECSGLCGSNNWQKRSEQEDEKVANVYSFGVILLEILSGSRCIDTPYQDYYSLHETVHGIGSKTLMDFVDPHLRNEIGEVEARNVINLGLCCIVKDPSLRPSMNRAVLVMEGLLNLCAPPLGRTEILPPSLRSHHVLQYQKAQIMNNESTNIDSTSIKA